MVTSRTVTGSRPVFPYGSRAYSILYFGVSARGRFTTGQIKNCLQGKFPRQKTNEDFIETAKRLVTAGLLNRVDQETWEITRDGVRAMISAAAYYREYRWRTAGITYMENANKRMHEINSSTLSLMEKLDKEDVVLEEIEARMNKRRNVKKNKK